MLSFYITLNNFSYSTILNVIYFACCAEKETEVQRSKVNFSKRHSLFALC